MINVPFCFSLIDEWEQHFALRTLNLSLFADVSLDCTFDYLKEINVIFWMFLLLVFLAFWRRFLYPFSLSMSVFLSVCVCQGLSVRLRVCLSLIDNALVVTY